MADAPTPTVLDTHVWIWMLLGADDRLNPEAVDRLEEAGRTGNLLVSAISPWEVAMLEAKGRSSLSRPIASWVDAALTIPGVRLLPLTPEIAVESANLPGDPRGDPADRILIASARSVGGRLATCDRAVLDYARAGHLSVIDCTI